MIQSVIDRIQDIGWWFDHFFFAIIVDNITSLITGFLVRRRSQLKVVIWSGRGEVKSELLSEHVLLTAHNFQTVIWLLLFVAGFTAFLYMRVYIGFTTTGRSPYDKGDTTFLNIVLPTVYLLLGLLCVGL
jgi:hypothetical protein